MLLVETCDSVSCARSQLCEKLCKFPSTLSWITTGVPCPDVGKLDSRAGEGSGIEPSRPVIPTIGSSGEGRFDAVDEVTPDWYDGRRPCWRSCCESEKGLPCAVFCEMRESRRLRMVGEFLDIQKSFARPNPGAETAARETALEVA